MISGSRKQPLKSCKIRRKRITKYWNSEERHHFPCVATSERQARCGNPEHQLHRALLPIQGWGDHCYLSLLRFYSQRCDWNNEIIQTATASQEVERVYRNSEVFHNGAMLNNAEPAVRPAVLLSHCLCLIKCFCGFCLKENADLLN